MSDTRERIACGAADAVEPETVLSFIEQNQPGKDMVKQRPVFVDRKMRDDIVEHMQSLGVL